MKKRSMALILCISTVLSLFVPIAYVLADADVFTVRHGGFYTENVSINYDEKTVLTASYGDTVPEKYQWQILIDSENEIWADIYDKTAEECEISYALVKTVLEDSGEARIRCKAFYENDWAYSNTVSVAVSFNEPEPIFVEEPEPVLVSDMEVVAPEAEEGSETVIESASYYSAFYAADGGEEKEYVTVTIHYLDAESLNDGIDHSIYTPYVATIEKDTEFSQSVVSPTFLGFAPFYDADGDGDVDDDASTVRLFFDSVKEDISIKVYYKPIDVNFAVKYFFQNVSDDLYTENTALYHTDKAETGTIITDEYLKEHAGDTTGFNKLYHIPEKVAADGSTVFECYYDRVYTLIKFDLDGGYGVDPIYARFGANFIVNNPINPGYIFAGWDLLTEDTNSDGEPDKGDGTADALPSTIPAEKRYYRALWTTGDTEYTVVGWIENDDGSVEYIGSYTVNADSGDYTTAIDSDPGIDSFVNNGEVFKHSEQVYYERADASKIVEGDGTTVVNVYYKYNEYTLRFYYAMSTVKGTDTIYEVVGGSTYAFGASATITDKNDEIKLLDQYAGGTSCGQVDELPTLKDDVKNRYTLGTEESGDYTFYYISFKARYNSNISELWPCDVFNSVTRTSSNTHGKWSGTEAYVSAWNGEHHVKYSQDAGTKYDGNQTIKGKYEKLDDSLLWDYSQFGAWADDEKIVSYLCFWENGADISWSVPELYRYNIYVELLDGQVTEKPKTTYNNKTYYLYDSYDTVDDSDVSKQTAVGLTGYNYIGRDSSLIDDFDGNLYNEAYNVNFYYDRDNSNTVTYINNGEPAKKGGVEIGVQNIAFGDDVSVEEPDYPSNLEPNAYSFGGWYTTDGCYEGSEFTEDDTMPAKSIVLYAKWVPKTHSVNFFNTYDEMCSFENGESVAPYATFTKVQHGDVVEQVKNPSRTENDIELIFAGWFYMENGEKKAFSLLDTPIKKDMNIFADWSSHSPQPYLIRYVLLSDENIKVADDTTGFGYAGSTRTFTAKAGSPFNQLYTQYNTGFFPTINSHSITMEFEADEENPVHNVYTFRYVQATDIEYTVRYINKETGVVMEEKTVTTSAAVVTERFVAFENMVPDAFYKRLVISVEWDDEQNKYVGTDSNVINFYYTTNKTSAFYAVHFMLEKLGATEEQKNDFAIDGSGGYEETGTYIEGVGTVGNEISITPQSFTGFELLSDKGKEVKNNTEKEAAFSDGQYSITVTAEGTELYIFYKRLSYSYKVHYYHYNTTTPVDEFVAPSEEGVVPYGTEITRTNKTISGYTCVSNELTQSITVGDKEEQNIIIFYYSPVQYVAEYVAVPPEGGILSRTIEVKSGTEGFEGSVPTANEYYEFVGWFIDEACTQPVVTTGEDAVGTVNDETGEFVPEKEKLSETNRNIFYAKFELQAADFTIKRENAMDGDQVFVYEVKSNEEGSNLIITVTVIGNGSTTICGLPLGNYTVTQLNNWSWRYSDSSVPIDHKGNPDTEGKLQGTMVVFNGGETKERWLSGNSGLVKNTYPMRKEGT